MKIKFVPRDLWIGLYVGPREVEWIGAHFRAVRRWYICIIPCFPIVITRPTPW